jgi:hypothetical protein
LALHSGLVDKGAEKTSLNSLTSEERRTRPQWQFLLAKWRACPAGDEKAAMTVRLRTNEEHKMRGNPRAMTAAAERRFPVRIRLGVPPGGLASATRK